MIKLVEWLLGHRADKLREETFAAESDVETSQAARKWAVSLGDEQRRQLAANHFGERMSAALEPRGWVG